KVSVSTPKKNRIPFGMFSVLPRMMLAYERLEDSRWTTPRSFRRRAASASVSPVGVTAGAVAVEIASEHTGVGRGGSASRLPRGLGAGSGREHRLQRARGGIRVDERSHIDLAGRAERVLVDRLKEHLGVVDVDDPGAASVGEPCIGVESVGVAVAPFPF